MDNFNSSMPPPMPSTPSPGGGSGVMEVGVMIDGQYFTLVTGGVAQMPGGGGGAPPMDMGMPPMPGGEMGMPPMPGGEMAPPVPGSDTYSPF